MKKLLLFTFPHLRKPKTPLRNGTIPAFSFYLLSFVILLLSPALCLAQNQVEMADQLRSSGKIYVVVGVLLTILLGIFLYLILIDRKVSEIEKKINKK